MEWKEGDLHLLYDDVLVRSVTAFRSALRHIEQHGAARTTEYVEHIRRGLRTMEAELGRRGIAVYADAAGMSSAEGLVGVRSARRPVDEER